MWEKHCGKKKQSTQEISAVIAKEASIYDVRTQGREGVPKKQTKETKSADI